MNRIERGAKRTAKPDIFISHSSLDKAAALNLASTLNFCSIDVWLDDWELDIGQDLPGEIARAMQTSRFIAILITENYNKSVWTKAEYKKALAREQSEGRVVMLPLIIGRAEIPDFLENKLYVDLRTQYFAGITKLVCLVHGLSSFRTSSALQESLPQSVPEVWRLLASIGFEPYVVVGGDDFDEMLKYDGKLIRDGYAYFDADAILDSASASGHIKSLIRQLSGIPRP